MIKLTQQEKEARGTAKKSIAAPRPLAEIRRDLKDAVQALADVRFAMEEAGKSIRTEGIWLVTNIIAAGGQVMESKKANPMLAIHSKCLGSMKVLKRSIVLLTEELQIATKEKTEASEFDEFTQ